MEGDQEFSFRKLAQRIRVPAGFVLAPLLIIAAQPTAGSLAAGGFISLVGLLIRGWASGCLRKNEELAMSGPYAHTRNPLYLGTFLLGSGIAVATGQLWFALLFIGLYLLLYVPVMSAEAETMRQLFPLSYAIYSKEVPMFVPRMLPYRASEVMTSDDENNTNPGFVFKLYLRHREYRAAIGTIAVYAFLAAEAFLLKS